LPLAGIAILIALVVFGPPVVGGLFVGGLFATRRRKGRRG
jgi:hypothetical protein